MSDYGLTHVCACLIPRTRLPLAHWAFELDGYYLHEKKVYAEGHFDHRLPDQDPEVHNDDVHLMPELRNRALCQSDTPWTYSRTHDMHLVTCEACRVKLDALLEQNAVKTWRKLYLRGQEKAFVSAFDEALRYGLGSTADDWWLARRWSGASARSDPFEKNLRFLKQTLPGLKPDEIEQALRARCGHTVRAPRCDLTLREIDHGWFQVLPWPAPCRIEDLDYRHQHLFLPPVP